MRNMPWRRFKRLRGFELGFLVAPVNPVPPFQVSQPKRKTTQWGMYRLSGCGLHPYRMYPTTGGLSHGLSFRRWECIWKKRLGDSFALSFPKGNDNKCVAAIQLAASNSPPDYCILFSSPLIPLEKKKRPPCRWSFFFLVETGGLEPSTSCV